MSQQKEQLLDIIDRAKSLEFTLLESVGENLETISTLDQLTEISEQARTRLSQLSTLHLRIAEVQPIVSVDLLKLMNEAIANIENRIPALERSLEEIKLGRNQTRLEAKMSFTHTLPEPEKIKQTLARAHRNCQEMELAGIQLEEVIAKLDREILTQRKQRLGKVLEQGQN